MCLAQGPQCSDAGEARTRDPSVSSQAHVILVLVNCLVTKAPLSLDVEEDFPAAVIAASGVNTLVYR